MSDSVGTRINKVMLNFVKGTDRLIEQRRQLLCTELGGYGIMDANVMNVCMKTAWMDRWKREAENNKDYPLLITWRGQMDMLTWRVNNWSIRDKGLTTMEGIMRAWEIFKVRFIEYGNNVNKTEIFENIGIMDRDVSMERIVFNGGRYEGIRERVAGKIVEEICDRNGTVKVKHEVDRSLGIQLTWAEYFRLRTEMDRVRIRFPRDETSMVREMRMDEFITGRRTGCKRYRSVM